MSCLLVAVPIIYLDIRGDILGDNVDHATVTVVWFTLSPRTSLRMLAGDETISAEPVHTTVEWSTQFPPPIRKTFS